MTKIKRTKRNAPGWPWELEVLTLVFGFIAVWGPYFVETRNHGTDVFVSAASASIHDNQPEAVKTQFRFMISVGIVALYVIHLMLASSILSHITVSPVHFFSPSVFALISHFRITHTPGFESHFGYLSKSTYQASLIFIIVITATAILMWFRRIRYMRKFSGLNWGVITKARYDHTYPELVMQMKPLFFPPRRYLACPEGIVIEGWHYAMPIGMGDINSMTKISISGILSAGDYYAGSMKNAVRIDLHDSRQGLFISPENPDEFIAFCEKYLIRRKTSGPGMSTRHGAPGHTQRIAPSATQSGIPR